MSLKELLKEKERLLNLSKFTNMENVHVKLKDLDHRIQEKMEEV